MSHNRRVTSILFSRYSSVYLPPCLIKTPFGTVKEETVLLMSSPIEEGGWDPLGLRNRGYTLSQTRKITTNTGKFRNDKTKRLWRRGRGRVD